MERERERNLALEGKLVIFKTALSKITFLSQVLVIPNQIIDALKQIQKDFLWNSFSPKVKHETICKDFQYGGLKNVDIKSKIVSLQCSWIKKLYDESFHEWKIIPLTLIKNTFVECFIFHSNLDFNVSLNSFPEFYINIFHSQKNNFAFHSLTPSCLSSCGLIKILKLITNHFIFRIPQKGILILLNIYASRLEFLKVGVKKSEYSLEEKMFYRWFQLCHAIPNQWKRIIKTLMTHVLISFIFLII